MMICKWFTLFVLIVVSPHVCSVEEGIFSSNLLGPDFHSSGTDDATVPNSVNITKVLEPEDSPIDDFPEDLFTDEERSSGAIVFHLFGTLYFFILLSIICNDYFLPSVECICEDLNISKDVAAATFMASATIAPEFFANLISSFVAESDVGVGGVLGSLMFNVLGVSAFAGMAATHYVQLDWWPVTRDCMLHAFSVLVLICVVWDGKVTLLESTIMVSLVSMYFIVLLFNKYIMHCMKWLMEINFNCCKLHSYDMPTSYIESNLKNAIKLGPKDLRQMTNTSEKPKVLHGNLSRSSLNDNPIFMIYVNSIKPEKSKDENSEKAEKSLWTCPMTSKVRTIWWIYTWPIKFVLTMTIPNPKTYRRMYPVTFVMCIIWIGLNSYLIIWMMTIIGYTFGISDAVMGLTFLAAGNCTPEALSSIIMIRKGERGVGVSNSLGSSSLDIFLSLGVTWFVSNLLHYNNKNPNPSIDISEIESTIFLLLLSVILLYVILTLSKYRLTKLVGVSLLLAYSLIVTLSIMIQSDLLPEISID